MRKNMSTAERKGVILVRIPIKLHQQFKTIAVTEDMSMQEILERYIEQYVEEN